MLSTAYGAVPRQFGGILSGLSDARAACGTRHACTTHSSTSFYGEFCVTLDNLSMSPILSALKTTGGAILRLTAASGHYLQPLARLLLAVVALRAGDRRQVRALLVGLAQGFRHNQLYATELAQRQ